MAHEDHLGKAARKRERPWLRAEDVLCGYSHKLKKLRKSEVMLVTYVPDLHIYIYMYIDII